MTFLESKRKKKRNWEDNDYYGSDEDEFLDRTGEIQNKRNKRMQQTSAEVPLTHDELVRLHCSLSSVSFF